MISKTLIFWKFDRVWKCFKHWWCSQSTMVHTAIYYECIKISHHLAIQWYETMDSFINCSLVIRRTTQPVSRWAIQQRFVQLNRLPQKNRLIYEFALKVSMHRKNRFRLIQINTPAHKRCASWLRAQCFSVIPIEYEIISILFLI